MAKRNQKWERHVWLSPAYEKLPRYPVVNATEYSNGLFVVSLQWRDTAKPLSQQLGPKREHANSKVRCEEWLREQGVLLDERGIVG